MAKKSEIPGKDKPVSLKMLAKHIGLSPATISMVLNDVPAAKAIPERTRKRVLEGAEELHYRPNFFARSLRTQQSSSIGIVIAEPSEGYFPMIMKGVEQPLMKAGYFFLVASHLWRKDLMEEYPRLLMQRGIDGLMLINTPLIHDLPLPIVAVPGHHARAGVTNIILDHKQATLLGIRHLYELGHRRIVFMRGPRFSLDTSVRWDGVVEAARGLGLPVLPELCLNYESSAMAPGMGYSVIRELLSRTRDFTAVFCFNDTTAIGTIRALQDAGLRCPEDVSVVGFDDILGAAYHTPSLTTIRQPLREMGETASELLLRRIRDPQAPYPREVVLRPELVVRESTSRMRRPAPSRPRKRTKS